MGEKAEYKNAIRSKKLIQKAFVELIQEKDIDKITVTDIVRRADINRGTFYAHYADTHAVVSQIENDVIAKMLTLIDERDEQEIVKNPLPVLLEVNHFLVDDIDFYRKLINSKYSSSFLEKLRQIFIQKMMANKMAASPVKNQKEFFITICFFAGGMVGLYQDWFAGRIDASLDDIAGMVSKTSPYRYRQPVSPA